MQERSKRPGRSRATTPRPAPALLLPAAPGVESLRAAAEALRLPMVLLEGGAEAAILFANPAFATLTGFAREELSGRTLASLLGHKGDTSLDAALASAEADGSGEAAEHCFRRKDGTTFWAALSITPAEGAEGGAQRLVALHDVTRQRQEADRMRLLLVEMNHRTQNMFSAVLEMIRHSLRGKAPGIVQETLTGRVLALSRAQNMLRDEMDGRVTLRQVLAVVLQPPTIPKELAERVTLEGTDVRLATNAALTVAMALHELAVNAVRHGALSGHEGVVHIHWALRAPARGSRLVLHWQESGGPRMKPLYDKGFGMRLIEGSIQHGLGGTVKLSLEASGLVCDITFPLRADGRNS